MDPQPFDEAGVEAIDAQASALMKAGFRLMGEGQTAAALDHFDRALAMRQALPTESDPTLRFGLAACWLNRAEALARFGEDANVAAALNAYDEGIEVLRGLPMGLDARFPRRLAIAHQNRGLTLLAQTPARVEQAIAAFQDALTVLNSDDASGIADRQFLQAAVWMNLANAYAWKPTAERGRAARDAAWKAIEFVEDTEKESVYSAEVGLKARHVICRTLAPMLGPAVAGTGAVADEVHQATDMADEGLALVRGWEKRGVTGFRPIAYDLFRFGIRVYGMFQPQFLKEFLTENLDPDQSSRDYVESDEIRSAGQEAFELFSRLEGEG